MSPSRVPGTVTRQEVLVGGETFVEVAGPVRTRYICRRCQCGVDPFTHRPDSESCQTMRRERLDSITERS